MEKLKLHFTFKYTETEAYRPLAEKTIHPARERELETIFSMGNGYIGTRNSLEESYAESDPGVFIAGMYVKSPEDDYNFLVRVPDWTFLKIYTGDENINLRNTEVLHHARYIDFNTATIVREWKNKDHEGRIINIKIIKYISLANKHELGKLLVLKPENYSEEIEVITGIDCNTSDFGYLLNLNSEMEDFASIYMKTKYSGKNFAIAQKSNFISHCRHKVRVPEYDYNIQNLFNGSFEHFKWQAQIGNTYLIKSLCSVCTELDSQKPLQCALSCFEKNKNHYFDISYLNHSRKWQERFKESRIILSGSDYDQKLVDFAIYHLITAGEFSGKNYSIPARNLSGESYKGHIFWDAEMFLLPFFIYTKPEIALNLIMYRYNTLDGARENALNEGYKGASFAWESTDTGLEAAPEMTILPNGEVILINSGKYENHISSDIAYIVWKYWQATEDHDFIANCGAEILFETARFCSSLIEKEEDGLYHINNVIGPDEYHELVNDNAYTNYLVKNNFDFAIKAYNFLELNYPKKLDILKHKINFKHKEIKKWQKIMDCIYVGYDYKTFLFEQFSGYYNLEYIKLEDYEPRSVPMDVILGRNKTKFTQVIKQADVLMFMFLFGENFSKEQVVKNYKFYEKRCGHGSSLSPGIHSIMAARAGEIPKAYEYFEKNARIDIGDAFGNAAGGIHIASLGAVWMSVVLGFAGIYTVDKGLVLDPVIPEEWGKIEFPFKWKGVNITFEIKNKEIKFLCSGAKNIYLSAGWDNWKEIIPNIEYTAVRSGKNWKWKENIYERESSSAS